jgi:hypothetical protein
MNNSTPMQLRAQAIAARQRFGRGEATIDELHAAFDDYIAGIVQHCRQNGKKPPRLSRSYLIRAL